MFEMLVKPCRAARSAARSDSRFGLGKACTLNLKHTSANVRSPQMLAYDAAGMHTREAAVRG
jgi:hypothetical protein